MHYEYASCQSDPTVRNLYLCQPRLPIGICIHNLLKLLQISIALSNAFLDTIHHTRGGISPVLRPYLKTPRALHYLRIVARLQPPNFRQQRSIISSIPHRVPVMFQHLIIDTLQHRCAVNIRSLLCLGLTILKNCSGLVVTKPQVF